MFFVEAKIEGLFVCVLWGFVSENFWRKKCFLCVNLEGRQLE